MPISDRPEINNAINVTGISNPQTIQLIDIILLSLMHNRTGTEESTDLHNGMNSHMTRPAIRPKGDIAATARRI